MACTRSIIGGSGVATASSQLSTSYLPSYAFDTNTATAWVNGGSLPAWLQYTLGTARLVCGYSIRFNYVTGITQLRFAPAAWTLQGSADGVGWTTVDTRAGQTFANPEVKSYTLTTPQSYQYWRLNVTANQDASASAAIVEMVLYERPMVSVAVVQSYGIKTGSDLVLSYADAPVVQLPLLQSYGDASLLVAPIEQRWRDMVVIALGLNQNWAVTATAQTVFEQSWAITSDLAAAALSQSWELRDRNVLAAAIQQIWWGDFDPSTVTHPSVTCTVFDSPVTGTPLNVPGASVGGLTSISGLTVELSLDQYAISATLQLLTLSDYLMCVPGSVVVIGGVDPGGQLVLRVDSRSRNRSGADVDSYSVELLSPAAWLDSPYAELISGEFTGMASEIAAQVVGSNLSVSWETVDWYIGAGRLSVENETPLSVVRSLAAAVGAVIQSSRDGGLRVISRYSVSVPSWGEITGVAIDEATTVVACSDVFEYNPGYNRFRVSDDEGTTNLSDVRVSVDETSDYVKIVRAQIPSGEALTLSHTGGAWVVVETLGRSVVAIAEPEFVEIVQGEGRTANTIYAVSSELWRQVDLGTVSHEASGLVTATVAGESLLEMLYSYEEQTWRISSPLAEKVQFVLEILNG